MIKLQAWRDRERHNRRLKARRRALRKVKRMQRPQYRRGSSQTVHAGQSRWR
jgi:hypothetical protein